MFVEIRKAGKKKKFYLVNSFREGKKVIKIRRYLGMDLSGKELENKKLKAEVFIREQLKVYREIRDPFRNVLSTEEINQVKLLNSNIKIKIHHLDEKRWLKFSELFSYDTNAIEGSTITKKEVVDIIEKKILPQKSSFDISETEGVVDAIKHIRKTKEHIAIDLIKKLHKIVFEKSKPFAGKLRERGIEVVIRDGFGRIVHQGAPSNKIVFLLNELIDWYNKNRKKYPPILLAAIVHNQFENIHPFQDGNGRVGRLLLNNILIKHNLPPVNIEYKNRKEYYETLQEYEKNGNIRPALELILKEYKKLRKF